MLSAPGEKTQLCIFVVFLVPLIDDVAQKNGSNDALIFMRGYAQKNNIALHAFLFKI